MNYLRLNLLSDFFFVSVIYELSYDLRGNETTVMPPLFLDHHLFTLHEYIESIGLQYISDWRLYSSLFLCLCPDKRKWCRLDARLHVKSDQYDSSRGSWISPSTPRWLCFFRHDHDINDLHPLHPHPVASLATLFQAASGCINKQIFQMNLHGGLCTVCGLFSDSWSTLSSCCGEVKGQCLLHIVLQLTCIQGHSRQTNAFSHWDWAFPVLLLLFCVLLNVWIWTWLSAHTYIILHVSWFPVWMQYINKIIRLYKMTVYFWFIGWLMFLWKLFELFTYFI